MYLLTLVGILYIYRRKIDQRYQTASSVIVCFGQLTCILMSEIKRISLVINIGTMLFAQITLNKGMVLNGKKLVRSTFW